MIMTMMTMMMTTLIANNNSSSEHKEMLSTGGKNGEEWVDEYSWEFRGLLHSDLLLYDFTSVIYLKKINKNKNTCSWNMRAQWAKGLLCR